MGENEILWDVKLGMFGKDFRLEKMMMICVFCYFFKFVEKEKKKEY